MFPPVFPPAHCRRLTWLLAVASVCLLAVEPDSAWAQSRKKTRKTSAAATLPKLATEVAFKNLQFDRPVVMAAPKDDKNLLFILEQHQAKIWSFPNDKSTGDKALFLELPDPINRGNEEGLLGLAFHPKYKENGEFLVYYSATSPRPRQSVVSRFRVSKEDPRKADPASEQRIWVSASDPYENHNGGCIEFGPDGFLYISLGDSGAADDPLTTGQNPKDWFASILRIDVDHPGDGKPYGIPADNPRLRDAERFGHWAPEVYCIGLRNVWKFTFDRETGTLWAGDVGQNLWEMVHIIQNGGNYGWSVKEAFHPFRTRQKTDKASKITPPIIEYSHTVGKSITGGYAYRGKALPDLVGAYVYADYDSGRIWGLREQDGKATENADLVDLRQNPKLNIMAFGEDQAGEIYILAQDGRIHQFVPAK
ncbi:MAG TPA: PQQ-dependent sugar dehydrogenase [Isosphaeraceae bacterium]|jgi:quinoprotein glucose dehydrogenase|nr:PQQ-dependent sugar dehydrogenase [Isosphaeraceae bacterium]